MQLKEYSQNALKSSIWIIVVITVLLSAIVAFSYINLVKNEFLQETTYHNRFQSRLIFKSISGLSKALIYLKDFEQQKEFDLLIEAEGMIQSAHSDYKIFLSEKHIHDEGYPLSPKLEFTFIEEKIAEHLDQEKIQPKDVSIIKERIYSTIEEMYAQEADIWKSEALRFEEIARLRERNRMYFYFMIVFFIASELGLIYFSLLRVKLLTRIEQQQEKLLISTRLSTLGEMSAEMAHEINNPLMVINGRIKLINEALKKHDDIDIEKIQKNVEIVGRNGERLDRIVKNYKLLSKNGTQDSFEFISLEKIFNDLQEITERRLIDANIQLTIENLNSKIAMPVKYVQILQVFTNLVSNSMHAIQDLDHKWIKINIVYTSTDVHFHFVDSGNGISKDHLPHIFNAFFTTKSSREGTGLGLNISAKIIQDHGGKIYYNEHNPHTEFVVILPRTQAQYVGPGNEIS